MFNAGVAFLKFLLDDSVPEGNTINSLLFCACGKNASACRPCFRTDSKWDARFQIFEEKTSAVAECLDEIL